MTQAYVTQSTVPAIRLAEITEQLATAADTIIGGIPDDSCNPLTELRQAFLVDFGRELQKFLVLSPLGVADVRGLLLGDEVQDVPLAETFQNLIQLLWL